MEPRNNLRLLIVALYLVVSINARLSPDVSPSRQPEAGFVPSPSPSPAVDPSQSNNNNNYVQFYPSSISKPPAQSISLNSGKNQMQPQSLDSVDLSVKLHSINANPILQKICESTDHPALCVETILPVLKGGSLGSINVDRVLEVAVKASDDFAKQALSVVKKAAEKPGIAADILSTLKDCKDSYETAVDNFQKTMEAFPHHDIGTMRSMLSAVITFVGDCEDEFQQMQTVSPLSSYASKLTNMTSNCLAIVQLMMN